MLRWLFRMMVQMSVLSFSGFSVIVLMTMFSDGTYIIIIIIIIIILIIITITIYIYIIYK